MILSDAEIASKVYGKEVAVGLSDDELRHGQMAATVAEALALSVVGHDLSMATRTEILTAGEQRIHTGLLNDLFRIDRDDTLILRYTPVDVSTVQVWVNDEEQDFSSVDEMDSDDYFFRDNVDGISTSGLLVKNSGAWPGGPGGVKVSYSGGLETDSRQWSLLKTAIAEIAKQELIRYQSLQLFTESEDDQQSGGRIKTSESLTDWSASWDVTVFKKLADPDRKTSIPRHAMLLLEELVNYAEFL